MTLHAARDCLDLIADLISEAIRLHEGCFVLVMGDFNNWPAEELAEHHPDVREVDHGPTRGHGAIDRTFCNFGRSVRTSGTCEPLENEFGRKSDHRVAHLTAVFERAATRTITYSYRRFTEDGALKFQAWAQPADWTAVYRARTATEKATALQTILDKAHEACFPLITTTRRESDPPWINEAIRKLAKKRRKVYDREGRFEKWKQMKRKGVRMIKKRARAYWDNQKKGAPCP